MSPIAFLTVELKNDQNTCAHRLFKNSTGNNKIIVLVFCYYNMILSWVSRVDAHLDAIIYDIFSFYYEINMTLINLYI